MTEKDYAIARQLKKRLSEVVDLLDLRVFGSRARTDNDEYSDMDVFLEVAHLDKKLKEKIFDIVWEIGYENYIVISPLILTKEELKNSPLKSSPIVKNILREGVIA